MSGKLQTAESGDAMMIALAALARAIDETGGVARKAALLTRLASTMAHLSEAERARLGVLTALFEGTAGDGGRSVRR